MTCGTQARSAIKGGREETESLARASVWVFFYSFYRSSNSTLWLSVPGSGYSATLRN